MLQGIGSQSALYGASGLRKLFVFVFIFKNLLWGSVNYGQSLHGLHNTKFENPCSREGVYNLLLLPAALLLFI